MLIFFILIIILVYTRDPHLLIFAKIEKAAQRVNKGVPPLWRLVSLEFSSLIRATNEGYTLLYSISRADIAARVARCERGNQTRLHIIHRIARGIRFVPPGTARGLIRSSGARSI